MGRPGLCLTEEFDMRIKLGLLPFIVLALLVPVSGSSQEVAKRATKRAAKEATESAAKTAEETAKKAVKKAVAPDAIDLISRRRIN